MTVHLVGLPHTGLSRTFSSCAFTSKALGLCRILGHLDVPLTVYWGGRSHSAEGLTGYVSLLDDDEQSVWFGDLRSRVNDPAGSIEFDAKKDYWRYFNHWAIKSIKEFIEPGDIVAVVGGNVQQEIVNEFLPTHSVIEPFAGYEGICHGTFVCFESYAWMHWIYGRHGINDGRFMDTVIPGYIDTEDFFYDKRAVPSYLLYLGRMTARKGVQLAADIAEEAGLKIIMAGAGDCIPKGEHVEYVGPVGPTTRAALLSSATMLLAPTLYIEPYGTVHVEALASGCPVLTTDFGGFTDTPGTLRFRQMAEAVNYVTMYDTDGWNGREKRRTRSLETKERLSLSNLAHRWGQWLGLIDAVRDGRNGFYAGTKRGQV